MTVRRIHRQLLAGTLTSVVAVVTALVLTPAAHALTVSPLPGTPDASPHTQISFLGVDARAISGVAVVGSRSGRHRGGLEAYASGAGASFLPSQPFAADERVTVHARVGARRTRVSWAFTIARQLPNPALPARAATAAAPPGAVQSFVSQPGLRPPVMRVLANAVGSAPGDVFLTPDYGPSQTGPMIVDGNGQLVWFQPAPPRLIATDLQLQEYDHQPVLVWWQGRIVDGVGFGTDEVYSASYRPLTQIAAGNGYEADLHDVSITPKGTAYITAYSLLRANLSSVGRSGDGVLQDAIVQEVDVRTGLVMFEWHAYGHVPLGDSYYVAGSPGQPWDYFHLNSVSPDPWGDGAFLISARNTWAAYEIDGHSGRVLWTLGGKHPSFRMGAGTGTAWQHDAVWQRDHTLTIFDNGAVPRTHSQSRAIHERIDFAHRTVTLVHRDLHAPALISGSQGNDQLLANGDAFVGWGESPYVSEFGPAGNLVFDAVLAGGEQSYRAYRYPWAASPASPPAIAVRPGTSGAIVYASWNGATGVGSWRVLAGSEPGTLRAAASAPRSGFETAIAVPGGSGWFAVQALGAAGEVLGVSAATHL